MIGIMGWPGIDETAFFRFPYTQIGGNSNPFLRPNYPPGIALDHGIFDADHPDMNQVPSWRTAAVRARMDAALVHEYIEATTPPPSTLGVLAAVNWLHEEAIRTGPDTTSPITDTARDILREYRQAEGLAP